jgi:transcriptional regulator with XRE-family HTH domain
MGRTATNPDARFTRLRYHLLGRGPMYKIAAAAGITPTTLSAYSLGTKAIAPAHLLALADVLDVPADDLLGDMANTDLEELYT